MLVFHYKIKGRERKTRRGIKSQRGKKGNESKENVIQYKKEERKVKGVEVGVRKGWRM